MDSKMINAWKNMQSAYKAMESVMNGGELKEEEAEGESEDQGEDMPGMEPEEGSYEGSGMMADQEKKKALLKAAMKGKGY